jgi:xylulokinase
VDPARLAPMLPSATDPAGELTLEAAGMLDLPAGIPVAAGAADAAAAAVGTGLVDPGAVQLTIGTGAQIVRPVATLPTALPPGPVTHLCRAATDKGCCAMGAGLNAGSTLAWVCRTLGASWQKLYATAVGEPGRDEQYFLPRLAGERTPYLDPGTRGAWTGLAPSRLGTPAARRPRRGRVRRSRRPRGHPRSRESDAPPVFGRRRDNRSRMAPEADVLAHPIRALDVSAASRLGAATLAARAAGLTDEATAVARPPTAIPEPGPDRPEIYRRRYCRYRELVTVIRQGRDHSPKT